MDNKNNKKLDAIQKNIESQQATTGVVDVWKTIDNADYAIADSARVDLINVDHGAFRLSLDIVQELEQSTEGDVLDGYVPITPNMLSYMRIAAPDYSKVFEKSLLTVLPKLDASSLESLDFAPFRVKVGDLVSISSTLTRPPEDGSSKIGQRAGQYDRLAFNFYIFCQLLHAATLNVNMDDPMAVNIVFSNLNSIRSSLGLDEATILGSFKVRRYVKREAKNYARVEKIKG